MKDIQAGMTGFGINKQDLGLTRSFRAGRYDKPQFLPSWGTKTTVTTLSGSSRFFDVLLL